MRAWAATWLLAAVAAGCTTGRAPLDERPSVRFAEGFYLEVWILGEDNLAVLYRVNGARELGFGGGVDAFNRNLSWEGELTPGEYERLQELLGEHGWFDGTATSTGEPRKRVTRVRIRRNGRGWRDTLRGVCEDVEPVRQLLDQASRRRLQGDLDRLPEAGAPAR